jgi:hypothetical protein
MQTSLPLGPSCTSSVRTVFCNLVLRFNKQQFSSVRGAYLLLSKRVSCKSLWFEICSLSDLPHKLNDRLITLRNTDKRTNWCGVLPKAVEIRLLPWTRFGGIFIANTECINDYCNHVMRNHNITRTNVKRNIAHSPQRSFRPRLWIYFLFTW